MKGIAVGLHGGRTAGRRLLGVPTLEALSSPILIAGLFRVFESLPRIAMLAAGAPRSIAVAAAAADPSLGPGLGAPGRCSLIPTRGSPAARRTPIPAAASIGGTSILVGARLLG